MRIRDDYLTFGKPNFSQLETDAVARVLQSGWVGMGPETKAFEHELAEYLKSNYAITVNSCTSALFLALLVSGVQEGDEVICPSLTWCSTANAVLYLRATPIFCDVDVDTMCMNGALVKEKITEKTKAVITVHYGGKACPVDEIQQVLPKGITLIEDAAHALGSRYDDGSMIGSKERLSCFSFYANKNLSTGDGGAVTTSSAELNERLHSLSHLGLSHNAWKRFSSPTANISVQPNELGYKMNLTDIQSAIGRIQLQRQPEFAKTRERIATSYITEISSALPSIKFQKGINTNSHAKHLFPIMLPINNMDMTRDEFVSELRNRNIGASVHYPPLHKMGIYDRDQTTLEGTDYLSERILTLPISSQMVEADVSYVVEHLVDVFSA